MDLIERIDALIADRHLLSHPFYTRWREGTLPVKAIQEYTRQYYAFESAFPRLLSALHSRTDDPAVRQSILDNLWDEEHGEVNHAEMWLRFAEGMGVERDEVRGAEPNEGTARPDGDATGASPPMAFRPRGSRRSTRTSRRFPPSRSRRSRG